MNSIADQNVCDVTWDWQVLAQGSWSALCSEYPANPAPQNSCETLPTNRHPASAGWPMGCDDAVSFAPQSSYETLPATVLYLRLAQARGGQCDVDILKVLRSRVKLTISQPECI